VFDHLGGHSVRRSYRLLASGGALVCYGMATRMNSRVPMVLLFPPLLTKLGIWNFLPNGHHATFYNVWGGKRRPQRFWPRLRADLSEVLTLLREGVLTAKVAARMPLTEVAAAMELAESGTVVGKVVLEP
jgi:NADPH2:quinone reductase